MGMLGAQILVQQNGSNCIANASQLFLSAAEKLVNVLGRPVVRQAQKPWRNVRVDGTTRFFGRALRQGRHENAGWQLRASIAAAFLIWRRGEAVPRADPEPQSATTEYFRASGSIFFTEKQFLN